jgi:TolA-binding protein
MTTKILLSIALVSATSFAQKREDFLQLQRDMATMQEEMKQLQKSQDEKMAALTSMVQQSLEMSNKISAGLTLLEKNVDSSLAEQQGKLVTPVAALGTKVDQMSDDFRGVKENISVLSGQLSKLDAKLTDVSTAIRIIGSAPQAPPTASAPPAAAALSAETLWENANRDLIGGKDELALKEYVEYAQRFPETEFAPTAMYNIGVIYDRADQNDEALKAFEKVLAFPPNPRSPDALYWKGMELMKTERPTESAAVFKEFIRRYPANENVAKAQKNLHELGMGGPAKRPPARKKQ